MGSRIKQISNQTNLKSTNHQITKSTNQQISNQQISNQQISNQQISNLKSTNLKSQINTHQSTIINQILPPRSRARPRIGVLVSHPSTAWRGIEVLRPYDS
jgi:hypothetical protein